jgi:hypothetical protein
MRAKLNLDEDVLRAAKIYAEDRSVALGVAVSELLRRGLTAPRATRILNGVRVFNLSTDSPRVTSKRVREIEAGA